MAQYVVIEDVAYPVDTVEEIREVEELLAELGEDSTPVYNGHPGCPDSYRSSTSIYKGAPK